MEKLAQAGEGMGVHAHSLSLYLPSRTKLCCTLQRRGKIHYPYFYCIPILCGLEIKRQEKDLNKIDERKQVIF